MTLISLSRPKLPLAFLLALSLSLALAGCAGFDEFGAEKKVPLTGQRKALFPEGVPGVEFGAPPAQPSNSNIAINSNTLQNPDEQAQQARQQQQQDEGRERSAAQPKQKQSAPDKSARTAARSKKSADEDPWMETR